MFGIKNEDGYEKWKREVLGKAEKLIKEFAILASEAVDNPNEGYLKKLEEQYKKIMEFFGSLYNKGNLQNYSKLIREIEGGDERAKKFLEYEKAWQSGFKFLVELRKQIKKKRRA